MRKVVLTPSDFEMFDTDINSMEFEFFQKHKEAFKRMWIEQGKKFWIQFVITFRQFAVDYGAIKEFPAKNEQFEDFVDQAFIIIHENFVDGKFGTARNMIMDIVMVAQHRHTLQYLESKSYAKDPFYNKETRDVFRRLFGAPTEKASYVKVYILLPLYMKYGGAVCVCLRRWLDANDCHEDFYNSNLPVTKTSSNNDKTSETSKSENSLSSVNNSEEIKSENDAIKKDNRSVGDGSNKKEREKKKSEDAGKKETLNKEVSTCSTNVNKSIQTDCQVVAIRDRSNGPLKDEKKEPLKTEKDKYKTNSKSKSNNDWKTREFVPTEDGVEAFKQLEVLSKDLVQSMHGHPFIKSSSIKVKLESGSGKDDHCSTFHSDGRVDHEDKMDEAEAKFNALMKMREEPMIHSDEYFRMYIDEVTKGSVLGPVHVPGWPRNEDPRYFDPDNPLYDTASKKDEWKSNLKLGDFQNFVRYVLANYKNGKKNQMVTLQTKFDLSDSQFAKVKKEISKMAMSPEEMERKKDQEKVAKKEEVRRKLLEDERKRHKKIRKKLKKGLPLDKDALSGSTTNVPLASFSSTKQDSDICSKCNGCTRVDSKEPGNYCPVHKRVHKIPPEQSQLTDPRKPYVMDSKLKDKQPDSPPFHEPKLLELESEKDIPDNEPNSVKLTKKVDEKAGTVSLTIEKRDQNGKLTKETTVKPMSENGNIWDEAMKKINMAPAPPVLNEDVQKQLAQKLSQGNFFEDSGDGSSSDMADGLNNSSTWMQGDDMQEEDRKQFRAMYCEISSAIADVSRQNLGEEEAIKCNHVKCNHDSRHEKARNRLRKKIGERRQDRRHPELPGLLRLGGNVEYPGNEREAMMITLAEMTKMTPRERELFQERLGRTKYFKDCQEDPRDVADSMGACLFPGMKKTLTDQKSQQKKEKVRAQEAKEEKEKQQKKNQAMLEESLPKSSDREDNEDEDDELCMADVKKVIMYKDDVKRMKKDLQYSNIKLHHMMEKKKENKEYIRTGREFDEQVRKASEDLRILEEKIAILDKECAGLNNPEFNANVLKAAEELKAVKKKVEKWEADADVLNEKIDKFEKEGDVNALIDCDYIDEADKDTHSDKDELDYELSKRLGPIDQKKAFEDFKEVMGLTHIRFEDNEQLDTKQKSQCSTSEAKGKKSGTDDNKGNCKENKNGKSGKSKNGHKKKDKKKEKDKKGDDIYLEINERIAADFQCTIPDCIGCKALKKFPDGYPGGLPADLDGHGHGHSSKCAKDEKDAAQKFIEDLDSGVLPPPPPGVSITVLQRVTEPVDVKPKHAINMGSSNPNTKEFKSFWKAAKHYGPTPPEEMLKDPRHCNLVITNTGTKEEPNINFGSIPTFGRDPSPAKKRKEKIQVKIARDRPLKREKTPSLTIEDVTEEENKKQSAENSGSKETGSPGVEDKTSKLTDKSRLLKQCSGCDKAEPFQKAFKKCQKCKVLGIKAARYYCGRDCQVSDWKKRHKMEHADKKME